MPCSHGDGEGELAVDEVRRLCRCDFGDGAGAGGEVGGGGGVLLFQAELWGEGSGCGREVGVGLRGLGEEGVDEAAEGGRPCAGLRGSCAIRRFWSARAFCRRPR